MTATSIRAGLLAVPLTACLTLSAVAWSTPAAAAADRPTPAAAASARPAPTAARTADVRLELPRPTGPHLVGRDILHLVDRGREDPWVPESGPRQLMVSMYYPARSASGVPAPYMTTAEAASLLRRKAPGVELPPEVVSGTRTYASTGAPPEHGRHPLVVLSPGFGLPRASLTFLAEDLASRGYVVALVDHAYESSGTTLPDGRTITCAPLCDQPKPPEGGQATITRSRTKDVAFVLDELTGRHPAWKNARVIAPRRIGMAGHSLGGDAGAATMVVDKRVRAGVNLDGTFHPAVALDRPFLLIGSKADHVPGKDDTWDAGWRKMSGWKRWLTMDRTDHLSFTDLTLLQGALGKSGPDALPPLRSLELTRAYVGAFFDLHLKGRKQPLLDGPSPANPEVAFHDPR
ncbi:alpha/beta hydrolase family protein [Nonomuraea rhodomycinica]|uniref:Alpha/beta hydrolase n=1 Tax=Nonomuraea rhodomycinica TaxID=1712872 RepID=A0A7Y6MGS1_9ACTN|nr:alpha/beta hydrolase [Nonomuraea rhodomycinica]NUW46189.1 alpha/beta hydrolase [Nonomuraea rhodomycinica]